MVFVLINVTENSTLDLEGYKTRQEDQSVSI